MDIYLFGLFVLLVFVFAAKAIINGANSDLSDNQRERLIDLFTWSGVCNMTRLALLLMLFFLSLHLKYVSMALSITLYISAVGILLVTSCHRACRKLKAAKFSDKYVHAFIMSTILRTTGLMFFFILVVAAE